MDKIEERIAEWLGVNYATLVASGLKGLWVTLRCLEAPGKKVVMPGFCCEEVVLTVLAAGMQPVFCDVNLRTYLATYHDIMQVVEENNDVAAVIAVSLFGQLAPVIDLLSFCHSQDILLIDDACQSYGGIVGFKFGEAGHAEMKCGALGDVGVISFGETKLLDVGGGGALLTNNADMYARIGQQLEHWPPMKIPLAPRRQLEEGWYDLDGLVHISQENAMLYRKLLAHPAITHPAWRLGNKAVWRYSFLVPSHLRDGLVQAMREKGHLLSDHYQPLNKLFRGRELPVSFRLSECIVNVFTQARYVDHLAIVRLCEDINCWLDTTSSG